MENLSSVKIQMNLLNCSNQCDRFQSMSYLMLPWMVLLIVRQLDENDCLYFCISLALQATVVTIQELKQYLSDGENNDTFIVQCFLSHFDLDGPLNQIITKKW